MNRRQPLLAWLVLLLGLAMLPVAVADTLSGTPLLRRYLPEDYNASPQHWAVTTDKTGRLYVGNGEGVLRYDGETWDLIGLPGKQIGRDVVTGRDGNIYVGSYDSFGWLRTAPDGEVVYQELLDAAGLKGRDRNIGDVWQVLVTDEGVYFRAERALHFLSYDRRTVRHWPLDEHQRSLFAQGKDLYARIDGKGFCRFVDGKFELEPGGELFAKSTLPGMLPRGDWRLLVSDLGFHRADAQGLRPLPGGAGSELRGARPYVVQGLDDGSFVVGTLKGELFRYGADLKLRDRVSLGSYSIVSLGSDREGGLWAATEGDLIRLSLPSPWSFYGAAQGLAGNAYDFEWHEGALWVAGTRGVTRMSAGTDGRIEARQTGWSELEAFGLSSSDAGLVIAHRSGLMVLDPGASEPRVLLATGNESVLELKASSHHDDRLYGLGDRNLYVLERRDGRWQLGFSVPLEGASAQTLVETGPQEIWIGDSRGGPQGWFLFSVVRIVCI